jgi:hypothetical protein
VTFYGEENNALLAPRGAHLHKKTLAVSDTGQNRVFIWDDFSFQTHQKASLVLGQKENSDTERNAGNLVSASSLQYPSGIWTNGKKLIVADAWNHRVLVWHTMPTQNFQAADVVIGQKDFVTNEPNIHGIGKPPSAQTLYWPYGVYSNSKELWIADTGNRRILYFENIPTTNFAAASQVIGQETFSDKDYNSKNAVWPYSIKISAKGEMLIADTQYYRVLFWKNWEDALNKSADIIVGQKNITDNGQNQHNLKPNAQTLNWVYDCCFFKQGIAIADTGNSRLIIHHSKPIKNNAIANIQIGQPNFETHGETSLSMNTLLSNEMYWPFSINSYNDILLAADTGNHRIIFYNTEND